MTKKPALVKGSVYTNGKGRFRKVLDLGDYPLYESQSSSDCVAYSAWKTLARRGLVRDRHSESFTSEIDGASLRHGRCTRSSFRSWMTREATPAEVDEIDALPLPRKARPRNLESTIRARLEARREGASDPD